jgi:hypothetical protein
MEETSSRKRSKEMENCAICLEIMDENENSLCSFGHQIHKECINEWISQGKQTCPACRSILNLFIEGYFEGPKPYFKYKNKNKRQYLDPEDANMIIGSDIIILYNGIQYNPNINDMIENYRESFPSDIMDTYDNILLQRNGTSTLNAICFILGFINDGIRNDLIQGIPIVENVYFNEDVWSGLEPMIKDFFLVNFEKIFIYVDNVEDEDAGKRKIKRKSVKRKSVRRKSIRRKSVRRKSVKRKSIRRK